MKVHFANSNDLISIVTILSTAALVCDINRIQKEAEIWILPFVVINYRTMSLNSSMFAPPHIVPVVSSGNSQTPMKHTKLLWYITEWANYFLKKSASIQEIARVVAAILCDL